MVRGRVVRPRDHLLATTLCVLWAWLGLVTPARAEPLVAGLRLTGPADPSLLLRVRGQTGDLDVQVQAVETGELEPSFAGQLEAARQIARERRLRVLIWARREQGALELVVGDFELDRVLVRALPAAASALAVSAQEEAAALVARSALRASLAGSALGQPSEELAPAVPPEPPALPSPPEPPAPPPAAPPPSARLGAGVELGGLSGLDGVSARGHHALFVRAFVRLRMLELSALAGYGVPVRVDERLAALKLAVHRAEASAGLTLARGPWQLVPSLAVGVHVLRLRAEARAAGFVAQNARIAALSLGALVRLGYQARHVGLWLRLGAAVLPGAPQLGYAGESGFIERQRSWVVQPELGLGVSLP